MSADPRRRYSPRMLRWFTRYLATLRAPPFHGAARRARRLAAARSTGPTILYGNHAAWWDPLMLLLLRREFFPQREIYAPIDAAALRRYPLLARFGFFGIGPATAAGAREFLTASKAVLASGRGMLALTAQGRFSDVRPRPLEHEARLGAAAA